MANKHAGLRSKVTESLDTWNWFLLRFLAGCFSYKISLQNAETENPKKSKKHTHNPLMERIISTLTVSVCVLGLFSVHDATCRHTNYTQARAAAIATQVITLTTTTLRWRLWLFHASLGTCPSFSPSLLPAVRSEEWNIHEVIWMTKEVKWGRFKGGSACDTWRQIVPVIVSSSSILKTIEKCWIRCYSKKMKSFILQHYFWVCFL